MVDSGSYAAFSAKNAVLLLLETISAKESKNRTGLWRKTPRLVARGIYRITVCTKWQSGNPVGNTGWSCLIGNGRFGNNSAWLREIQPDLRHKIYYICYPLLILGEEKYGRWQTKAKG